MRLEALFISALLAAAAWSTGAEQKPKIIYVRPENVPVTDGAEMFRAYCAPCHGIDAKGDGPAGAALKKAPADLTQLSRKYGPGFPTFRVKRVILGAGEAHGSREMPVWGSVFRSIGDDNTVTLRIGNLTKYLESIQAK